MSRDHVFGLDLLRALAIALVLVAHASFLCVPMTRELDAWWMLGQLGVELFFVLSGFLIGGLLAGQVASGRLDVRNFWLRRWLRTLPNYYLFVAINLLLERWASGAWPHVGSYLVFMQNFAWPVAMFFNESWSLAIEEIFYLVAPLAVLAAGAVPVIRRSPVVAVLACIALFTAMRIGIVLHHDPVWDEGVHKVVIARLDAIAYGVVAVLLYRHWQPTWRMASLIAASGAAIVVLCVATYLLGPRDHSVFMRTLWFNLISIGFAAWLPLAALWQNSGLPALMEAGVRKLALWSYALYVSQLALMRALQWVLGWKSGETWAQCFMQAFAFAVLALALAALVYYAYERPFLRLRERIAPRGVAAVA